MIRGALGSVRLFLRESQTTSWREALPFGLDWTDGRPLGEFDAAHQYARQQGWLIESGKAFSTILTPSGWRAARGE